MQILRLFVFKITDSDIKELLHFFQIPSRLGEITLNVRARRTSSTIKPLKVL